MRSVVPSNAIKRAPEPAAAKPPCHLCAKIRAAAAALANRLKAGR